MAESLAAFRDQRSRELRKLAEEHLQHEYVWPGWVVTEDLLTAHSLTQSDRDVLRSAGSKVSTHAKIGSLLGLGFGVYCAFRLRTMRLAYFKAFRTLEKPVEVRFADGRTGRPGLPWGERVSLLTPAARAHPRYHGPACTIEVG